MVLRFGTIKFLHCSCIIIAVSWSVISITFLAYLIESVKNFYRNQRVKVVDIKIYKRWHSFIGNTFKPLNDIRSVPPSVNTCCWDHCFINFIKYWLAYLINIKSEWINKPKPECIFNFSQRVFTSELMLLTLFLIDFF